MRTVLLAGVILSISALGWAAWRQPADARLQADPALAAVARLVGRWEGEGWTTGPDSTRRTYAGIERARWNLAKTAILIEGLGTAIDPDTGELVVGHDAFGYVRANEEGVVEIQAYRAGGTFERHELRVEEDGSMRWELDAGRGHVRFTIRVEDGTWNEVGEFSQDGETWRPFLGMRLHRVDDGR